MAHTNCPYCKSSLLIEEYENIRCNRCGGNLAAYSRLQGLKYGLGFAVALVVAAYFYFHSKGGWGSASVSEKESVVAMVGLILLTTILAFIINWVVVEKFHSQSKKTGFVPAIITALVLWYTPPGVAVQQYLLHVLS